MQLNNLEFPVKGNFEEHNKQWYEEDKKRRIAKGEEVVDIVYKNLDKKVEEVETVDDEE